MKNQALGMSNARIGFFQGEQALVLMGLLGFVLAALCAVWVLIWGGEVAPGGDVTKAISFNAALGAFILSTAAIIPLSGLGEKGRAFFRRFYVILALYSYGAETVQNMRGVNPRFVKDGSAFDYAVGNLFALVALLLVVVYLYLAVQFFKSRAYALRPELNVGIRYAMVAVVISFAAGIWISMNQGRTTGLEGNIIWLHGLGFHALQVMPLVAWLAERSPKAPHVRRRGIHITGIAYVLGLLAIGWQTWNGDAVMEVSVLPLVAGFCFLVTIAVGALMLRRAAAPASRTAQWGS